MRDAVVVVGLAEGVDLSDVVDGQTRRHRRLDVVPADRQVLVAVGPLVLVPEAQTVEDFVHHQTFEGAGAGLETHHLSSALTAHERCAALCRPINVITRQS